MTARTPFALTVTMIAVAAAQPVAAQMGIAIRASTLGVGGEVSFRANRHVGLRAGGNYLSFSRNATIEGISYDMAPKLQNGVAIVDLHPFGGSFHLSGGLLWNSNEGSVDARLAGPVTIGARTYQPDEVGALSGLVRYPSTQVPYAGLGFAGRGRVSLLFDLGVAFSGYPRVSLTGSTNLTGAEKEAFDQNVQQEIAEIQAEIESRSYLKYYPVVSLGIRVGF